MRSTVYPPREDTYLLKETVEGLELDEVEVLELGCGNGVIAETLEEGGAKISAVDINKNAVENTEKKLKEPNKHSIKYSDLFENVEKKNFEFVFFNPPYLGGKTGLGDEEKWHVGENNILERFFNQIDSYLSENGEAYLVLSDRTPKLDQLIEKENLEIEAEKKLWFEKLYVVRYK